MPFTPPFQTTPPVIDFKGEFLVSYFETAPHVCLLTFNRPKKSVSSSRSYCVVSLTVFVSFRSYLLSPRISLSCRSFDSPRLLLALTSYCHPQSTTHESTSRLNTFWTELSKNLSTFMDWADAEPEIWVFIITGNGRAFSCGGDLEAWFAATQVNVNFSNLGIRGTRSTLRLRMLIHCDGTQAGEGGISGKDSTMVQTGAAGLSRRVGVTPIIAAVNGLCIGGGCEIAVNCTSYHRWRYEVGIDDSRCRRSGHCVGEGCFRAA